VKHRKWVAQNISRKNVTFKSNNNATESDMAFKGVHSFEKSLFKLPFFLSKTKIKKQQRTVN